MWFVAGCSAGGIPAASCTPEAPTRRANDLQGSSQKVRTVARPPSACCFGRQVEPPAAGMEFIETSQTASSTGLHVSRGSLPCFSGQSCSTQLSSVANHTGNSDEDTDEGKAARLCSLYSTVVPYSKIQDVSPCPHPKIEKTWVLHVYGYRTLARSGAFAGDTASM